MQQFAALAPCQEQLVYGFLSAGGVAPYQGQCGSQAAGAGNVVGCKVEIALWHDGHPVRRLVRLDPSARTYALGVAAQPVDPDYFYIG